MDATFIVSWLKPSSFSTFMHDTCFIIFHYAPHLAKWPHGCQMVNFVENLDRAAPAIFGASPPGPLNTIQCRKLSSKPDLLEIPFDTRNIHDNRISTIWSRTVRPICSADALTFLNPSSNFWNESQSLFKWPRPASQMRLLLGKEIGNRPWFRHPCFFLRLETSQTWRSPFQIKGLHEAPGDLSNELKRRPSAHLNLWTCSTRCGWFLLTKFSRVIYGCKQSS